MAKSHVIPITNGKGSLELDNGTYNVTATVAGYDVSTIDHPSQEITEGVNIYYKQTSSDGEHTFNSDFQTVTLEVETHTIEVENAMAAAREFSLTDAYYEGLPIEGGSITLEL